ncbi:MAG: 1,4-alpha-glucan branching enzyme, partial [Planctomycetes bacterium]|nr:1,4-alpha-glucan branching enzyme [Planctomycetota bacterium]
MTYSPLTEDDIFLFRQGRHFNLHRHLGAHLVEGGTHFAVWAPNAASVSVIGDFNGWRKGETPLMPRWDSSGIWEGEVAGVGQDTLYKYAIVTKEGGQTLEKADPLAFKCEGPPHTASIVSRLDYAWHDEYWMAVRRRRARLDGPVSIYEVHIGSWQRDPGHPDRFLTYTDLAHRLPEYVNRMGFTHVEFLPVMEHPFYPSWGYQTTGYFAPSSRYGTPQDFMYLIDCLHQQGIGVILDWVPSHFPADGHGLAYFDGTALFEHGDPREGFHPDWRSNIFNLGRNEVQNFLISSALFWLQNYHIDGIRVDAVASMLYRDYSRKDGEWIPNRFGGRENEESVSFLKIFNETVYREFPDVQTYAERGEITEPLRHHDFDSV